MKSLKSDSQKKKTVKVDITEKHLFLSLPPSIFPAEYCIYFELRFGGLGWWYIHHWQGPLMVSLQPMRSRFNP